MFYKIFVVIRSILVLFWCFKFNIISVSSKYVGSLSEFESYRLCIYIYMKPMKDKYTLIILNEI
jgi:hypothetical protein